MSPVAPWATVRLSPGGAVRAVRATGDGRKPPPRRGATPWTPTWSARRGPEGRVIRAVQLTDGGWRIDSGGIVNMACFSKLSLCKDENETL